MVFPRKFSQIVLKFGQETDNIIHYSICYRQFLEISLDGNNVQAHAFHNTCRATRSGRVCACAKASLRISGNE
jgi:hypothetical protein